jgi:hypothetical protein
MLGVTTKRLPISPSTRRSLLARSTWTACCKNDGCVAAVTWHKDRSKKKRNGCRRVKGAGEETYIQKDAVRESHLDRAALVYLELADCAVHVRWRLLLLVHVLRHRRGGLRIGRERDAFALAARGDVVPFAGVRARRGWGDESGEGCGELEEVQALLSQVSFLVILREPKKKESETSSFI